MDEDETEEPAELQWVSVKTVDWNAIFEHGMICNRWVPP